MLKYRIKFKFEKEEETVINRDNNINVILSDIDSIVSDTPIRKPLDGEVILVCGVEYKVYSVTISFDRELETTYYDFNVLLYRKNIEENRQEEAILIKKMEEYKSKILLDKYLDKRKYDDNKKFYL